MNKKVISGVIAVIMMLTSIPAFAVSGRTFEQEKNSLQLLQALGVVEADSIYDWEETITRGTFAQYLGKLITKDAVLFPNAGFRDVDEYDEAYESIAALAAFGIINGNENGEFRPYDVITVGEAVKMIVCAMGYDFVARQKGGYPMGYIQVAADKNVIRNINAAFGEELQVWQALVMLSNMLESDISDSNLFDGISQSGQRQSEIYMNKRLSVYLVKGIITDNGITSLGGKTSVKKGEIKVDGVVIGNASGAGRLLGNYAEVYYKYDEKSGECSLIYCRMDNKRNRNITLKANDILDYGKLTYSYMRDEFSERIEKMQLNVAFTVIYNGKALEDSAEVTKELMIPDEGTVTLIDNNGDGLAEVVCINSYRTIVVGRVDRGNYIITDKNGESFITLNPKDMEYYIEDEQGNSVTFESITSENTVLFYSESLDKDYAEILFSRKTVAGTVTEIENENVLIIDGGSFRISKSYKKEILLGDKGTFYLNPFGEIAYYTPDFDSQKKFAYIVAANFEGGLKKEVIIRVFTDTQELKNYELADRVNIDGTTYHDGDKILDALNASGMRQVVRFVLNHEGRVSEIDTPYIGVNESTNSLNIIPGLNNAIARFYYTNAMLGGTVSLKNNCLIFLVPAEFDEEQIRIVSVREFEALDSYSYAGYPVTAYRTNGDSSFADAVIITKNFTGIDIRDSRYSDSRDIYLVEKVTSATNLLGNQCNKLTLSGRTEREEYYTTSMNVINFTRQGETYQLEPGDVILFGYDKNRLINEGNLIVIYDESEDWFNTAEIPGYATTFYPKNNTRMSWCYSIENDFVKYAPSDPNVTEFDKYSLYMYKHDFNNTVVFNRSTKKSRNGSINDLKSFEDYGPKCSMFISRKTYNYAGGFCVIYED